MKEILKQLRQENGFSQIQIAEQLGITRQTYIKYEQGELEPSIDSIRKLASLYKVDYSILIDNKHSRLYNYKFSDFPNTIASPAVPYGTTKYENTIILSNADYSLFQSEAKKRSLSLLAFIKVAAMAYIEQNDAEDTLNLWTPLQLGNMKKDYLSKDYQDEILDGSYDSN